MGSTLDNVMVRGVLVHEPDLFSFDTLDSSGSYSEAGPGPGSPVPGSNRQKLVPRVTNNQTADLDLEVTRGGNPGTVELIYKEDSAADSSFRGWNAPNALAGWSPIKMSDSASNVYDRFDAAVIPSSQQVVAVRGNFIGSVDDPVGEVWDPSDWTWTQGTDLPDLSNPTSFAIAVCILPGDERALCLYFDAETDPGKLYESTDAGSTWTQISSGPLADGGATLGASSQVLDRARMVVHGGNIALLVFDDNAGKTNPRWHQYASRDGGATFDRVGNTTAITGVGRSISLVSMSSGRLIVGYVRDSDDLPCIRIVGSAYSKFEDATAIQIGSTTMAEAEIVAEPDGTLWCFGRPDTVTDTDQLIVYVSRDEGATWSEYDFTAVHNLDNNHFATNFRGVPSNGSILLLHNSSSTSGDHDGSLASYILGGWSNVAWTQRDSSDSTTRTSYGEETSTGDVGSTWTPIDLPDTMGWTQSGAGTYDILTADEAMEVSTSSSVCDFEQTTEAGNATILVKVESGGNQAANDVVLDIRWNPSGSARHRVILRFDTTGFQAFDSEASSTVGSAASVDMTQWLLLEMIVGSSGLTVRYARPGDTVWTVHLDDEAISSTAAAAAGRIRFAHVASATAVSHWRMVAVHHADAGRESGKSSQRGRPISIHGYPLPDIGDSTRAAMLRVEKGPGFEGDTYEIPVRYSYGIERIHPDQHPSPTKTWRSTDLTEQTIVWQPAGGRLTWLGPTPRFWGICLRNCNFKTAYFESKSGAGSWTTLATINMAVDFDSGQSLTFTRSGDLVYPNTGTTGQGGRLVQQGEFAYPYKGHLLLGATPDAIEVERNSGGAFTQNTTVQPYFEIDSSSGPGSSGAIEVVHHSGVFLFQPSSNAPGDLYRLRIPNQACPDAYFEIGNVVIGAVRIWGRGHSRGWEYRQKPNRSLRRTPYGTTHVRQQGPAPRQLTIGWPDGFNHYGLRNGDGSGDWDNDFIQAGLGGPALAMEDQVWDQLWSLTHDARSGERMVVALPALGRVSALKLGTEIKITDPTLYLYSRLLSDTSVSGVVGQEGSDEYMRAGNITFEEVV